MKAQDAFSTLFTIFDSKNWLNNTFSEDAIASLVNIIDNINDEGKGLIFNLLKQYHWIKFNDMEGGILNIIHFLESLIIDNRKMVIGPVIKADDKGSLKSGMGFSYQIKSHSGRSKINSKNTVFISEYDNLKLSAKDILIIVDDYIGSGRTVMNSINELVTKNNIDLNQVQVIVYAAQRKAIDLLARKGIKLHYELELTQGISDYYPKDEIEGNLDLMRRIEKILPKLNSNFSLGYEKTEAVITFNERTPNNTFPIFWLKHEIDGREFTAPFPR